MLPGTPAQGAGLVSTLPIFPPQKGRLRRDCNFKLSALKHGHLKLMPQQATSLRSNRFGTISRTAACPQLQVLSETILAVTYCSNAMYGWAPSAATACSCMGSTRCALVARGRKALENRMAYAQYPTSNGELLRKLHAKGNKPLCQSRPSSSGLLSHSPRHLPGGG